HAPNGGHMLQPVFDGGKLPHRFADLRWLASHQGANADRRENILDVVRPLQRDLRYRQDFMLATGVTEEDAAFPRVGSRIHFLLAAEPEDLGASSGRQFRTGAVVGVEHSKIRWLLVLENTGLGAGIGSEREMPVQVIGRDVEHNRDVRTECLDGLKLEAGDFQNGDRIPLSALYQ